MEKLLLFSISVVVPICALRVQLNCRSYDSSAFLICDDAGVLMSIYQDKVAETLTLHLNNYSAIAPKAFQRVRVEHLQLDQYPTSKNCIPKFLNLAPETFSNTSWLRGLNLHCVRVRVNPNPFRNLESVISLLLERVEFEGFVTDVFSGFPNLERLTLVDLDLLVIAPVMFSSINRKLTHLAVHDAIGYIEPKSFERFGYLLSLDLSGNELNNLRCDIFEGLLHLEHLDLYGNVITLLKTSTFVELPLLQYLSLQFNRINEIEAYTFSNLHYLRELNLAYNSLEKIDRDVFQNLRNLEYLDLRSNKIKIIRSEIFRGCSKLRTLDLVDNQIHRIDPKAFFGLHLKSLDLTDNDIDYLGFWSFYGLHVDEALILHGVTRVHVDAFTNLAAYKVILCCNISEDIDRKGWNIDSSIKIFENTVEYP